MAILVANNATSYLAGTLTAVATSLTVSSGTGTLFPTISGSDVFYVTLTNTSNQNEIVKVTAKATDTFTIVRAQDGTSARAFAIGDKVELRVIKVVFDDKASLTNDQTFSGANTFSGGILFGAGTAALPSITTTGDTNTGIFFPAADTIAFTEGGAEAMRVDSNGDVGIGTTSPVEKLSVVGQISTSGSVGGFLLRDRATNASSSQWYSPSVGNTRLFDTAAAADRVTIDANGNVGIGITTITNTALRVSKNITGATTAQGIRVDGAIQTDVTGSASYFQSATSMASGTMNNLYSFDANQGTIGATVSNQIGFRSATTLIGATNNYGFFAGDTQAVGAGKTAYGYYSDVDIATGGGTTYGFYAAGTAPNYFNGNVGIGTTAPSYKFTVVGGATQLSGSTGAAAGLRIQSISGAATLTGINANNDTNFPIAFVTTAEAMRIDTSLNVGIGTTTPQAKLSVSNGGAAGLEFFVNYPGGGVGTYIQSYNRSGTAYVSTAYDAADHSFRTSGTERLRIASAGQIGIGGANYGTSGQVLTSGGASAAPSWADAAGGGAWKLIQTQTASASSSINFTGLSGYSRLRLSAQNISASSVGADHVLRLSSDNGATYLATSSYVDIHGWPTSATATGWGQMTDVYAFLHLYGNGTYPGLAYEFTISNFNIAERTQLFGWSAKSGSGPARTIIQGYQTGSTAMNAIRILQSTGTITTGTFILEGIVG